AFKCRNVDRRQIVFKQDLVLARYGIGYLGLIFKQRKNHAKGDEKLGYIPEETGWRRPDVTGGQEHSNREHAAPDNKGCRRKYHSRSKSAEVAEVNQPGNKKKAEQIKVEAV